MSIEKSLSYEIKDFSGKTTNKKETITLKVSAENGNNLIHRAFIKQQKEHRQGTASTKRKSEVQGGGRKPWQQKGRGRARAGSSRSPLWRGGGVTFGPQPKDYTSKLNKKEWKLSFQTLLYSKRNNILVVENFNSLLESTKTKELLNNLKPLFPNLNENLLLVTCDNESNILLAARNIPHITTIQVNTLNVKAILEAKNILLSVKALKQIQEIYCG